MAKTGNPGGSGGPAKKKKRAPKKKKATGKKPATGTEVRVQDSGQMATTASTTAPVSAMDDDQADQSDADLDAFFSSGTGPALHYDQTAAGGVGQEQPAETASAP